jgi:quercetin dioxygenase-like cupin family protein
MRHFLQLASGLDVLPLLYALHRQPWLWDANPIRTTFPGSPHAAVSDILLRFNQGKEYQVSATPPTSDDDHECVPFPAWWALLEAHPLVYTLLAVTKGTRLGRVMITKLPPGAEIPPHIDSPGQTAYYARHHITLAAPTESYFLIDEETVHMAPGETWLVDNSQMHGVINHGDQDRIALIIDIHRDTAPEV